MMHDSARVSNYIRYRGKVVVVVLRELAWGKEGFGNFRCAPLLSTMHVAFKPRLPVP